MKLPYILKLTVCIVYNMFNQDEQMSILNGVLFTIFL